MWSTLPLIWNSAVLVFTHTIPPVDFRIQKMCGLLLCVLLLFRLSQTARICENATVDLSRAPFDMVTKYITYEKAIYKPDNYYIKNGFIFGCVCEVKTCVHLCCPHGFTRINGTCIEHPLNISLNIYNNGHQMIFENSSNFHPITFERNCTGFLLQPHLSEEDNFFVQSDGSIYTDYDNIYITHRKYCISYFNSHDKLQAHICMTEEDIEEMNSANSYGMIISIPFLLITLLVYLVLPDKNIHRKCQMAYVFSLMCAYFFLVYIQFNNNQGTTACNIFASLCLLSFMSSFCWMNISCIDIFWTFSGKRGFGHSQRSVQQKRFLLYCLYAYGGPLILLGIIYGVNQLPDYSKWYHPNFAIGKCWFATDDYPLLLYFYGPMGFLLLVNTILFILTSLRIREINQDTAMLRKEDSRKHYESDKQRFNLYFKLLLAMGINWFLEFLSWMVDWLLKVNNQKKIPEIWYLTDLCNALYGVFIFFLFICKRNIWVLLKKRYYILMGQPQKARDFSMRTSNYQMSQTEKTDVSTT